VAQYTILCYGDTLLYIDSLLPNTSYQYQVTSIEYQVSSDKLNVTTMDTTSHNFTWQTWTFGEHSSSVLYDVAIINENSIYVVGEIYMNDSLGHSDLTPYNLAIWDGNNWELMKLTYQDFPPVIHSVCAINENNIWFDPWFHWNGQNFQELSVDPVFDGVGINKMWGNEDEIYVVGNEGFIAHRNANGSWHSIESGTSVDIHDIWGSVNYTTDEKTILAIASFQNYGRALDLLKIIGTSAIKLDTTGLHVNQHSLWFVNNSKVYIVGNGVYYKNDLATENWQLDESHPLIYKERIRGTESNNIFLVGDYGLVSHFNGVTWKHFTGNELPNLLGNYYSVDIKNNIMVAVGQLNSGQAIVLKGDR